MNCLIGISNHTGGGVVIFEKLKSTILRKEKENWLIIYPTGYIGEREREFIIPNWYRKRVFFPLVFTFLLGQEFKRKGISKVLNLSDLPVKLDISQFFLFDWSYLAYPRVAVHMSFLQKVNYTLKKYMFKVNFGSVTYFAFQHTGIQKRMEKLYGISNSLIWPNGFNKLQYLDVDNCIYDGSLKILVLSKAYPHKRLELVKELSEAVQRCGLKPDIKITIHKSDNAYARSVYKSLKNVKGVSFLGNQNLSEIPALYSWSNLVFAPSQLESFSGLLVESTFYKRPILCSDLDFNRSVAGQNSYFFGPQRDIYSSVEQIVGDIRNKKVSFEPNLEYYKSWDNIATKILSDVKNL